MCYVEHRRGQVDGRGIEWARAGKTVCCLLSWTGSRGFKSGQKFTWIVIVTTIQNFGEVWNTKIVVPVIHTIYNFF